MQWTGGSASKPGKPKGKKKFSSVRQKFDVRCLHLKPMKSHALTTEVVSRLLTFTLVVTHSHCSLPVVNQDMLVYIGVSLSSRNIGLDEFMKT